MVNQETFIEQVPPGAAQLAIVTNGDIEAHELLTASTENPVVAISAAELITRLTAAPGDWGSKQVIMVQRENVSPHNEKPRTRNKLKVITDAILTFADERIVMDDRIRSVMVDGEKTRLSIKEYDVLRAFGSNLGRILYRQQLFDVIWQGSSVNLQTVDWHVSRIRKVLGPELGDKEAGAIRTAKPFGWYALKNLRDNA